MEFLNLILLLRFHRKDRYNLAKIEYIPYLLQSNNPGAIAKHDLPTFVPSFQEPGTNDVGGEIDGEQSLKAGEYTVKRDINVRQGGTLNLHPGVTLRFQPAVGIMIAGKLVASGSAPNSILMTLKEDIMYSMYNDTIQQDTSELSLIPIADENNKVPVRLLGGKTSKEGRLQVSFCRKK